jgi:hypothetical protein
MSQSGDSDTTACDRAAQAAAEVLGENCPASDFEIRSLPRKEMKRQSLKQLGLLQDELEPDCDEMLERGFGPGTCDSNPEIQQLVYCMVWNEPPVDTFDQPLIDVFGGDVDQALEQAFRIHRTECSSD